MTHNNNQSFQVTHKDPCKPAMTSTLCGSPPGVQNLRPRKRRCARRTTQALLGGSPNSVGKARGGGWLGWRRAPVLDVAGVCEDAAVKARLGADHAAAATLPAGIAAARGAAGPRCPKTAGHNYLERSCDIDSASATFFNAMMRKVETPSFLWHHLSALFHRVCAFVASYLLVGHSTL